MVSASQQLSNWPLQQSFSSKKKKKVDKYYYFWDIWALEDWFKFILTEEKIDRIKRMD